MVKRIFSLIADVALYAITFLLLQVILFAVMKFLLPDNGVMALVLSQTVSTILSVVIFIAVKWASVSDIKNTKRKTILLVAVAALALTLLPASVWLIELSDAELPEMYEEILRNLLSEPLGIMCIALFVPLAEEVVFRGAILRRLLMFFPYSDNTPYRPWIAIVISALLFALIHGNMAQGSHALAIGAFLGWLYYRTDSIIPGVVFHCINNTSSLISVFFLDSDAQFIDICGGDYTFMYTLIVLSALVSLGLLALIVKKAF